MCEVVGGESVEFCVVRGDSSSEYENGYVESRSDVDVCGVEMYI